MTSLKKSLLSAVVTVAGASGARAQLTGSNATSVGGDSATASASGGQGSSSSPFGNTNAAFAAPVITGLDPTAAATSTFLNQSNILGGYYANPFFAGRAGAALDARPGGFGDPLFRSQSGSLSASGGFGAPRTNAFSSAAGSSLGSAGGFGGNAGLGGLGTNTNRGLGNTGQNRGNQGFGQNFGGNQFGVVIPAPGPIAYTATLRFAVSLPTAPQVAADLRGTLDRTSMLTNSRTIDLFTDGSTVVLRGTVPNAQESETAEGMIRLTPGVLEVRNELQVVAPTPTPAVVPTPTP